ncbi:hypothetical protein FPOAC2_01785 [Fusarium poae]|jgi:hypothetical protein
MLTHYASDIIVSLYRIFPLAHSAIRISSIWHIWQFEHPPSGTFGNSNILHLAHSAIRTSSIMPGNNTTEYPPALRHIVQPGEEDVATTSGGVRMHVGAAGRRQFQEVWLWPASYHKEMTPAYNVQTHGPSHSTQSLLPSGMELEPNDVAVRMLEIGLVIADEPDLYVDRGHSRNKYREQQRKERGILTRNSNVFRAYIKASDYIQPQAKTFIGCMLLDGRLCALKIKIDSIFFYKEF